VGRDDEALRILMVEYQGGSLQAFEEIYCRLAPELQRYLRYLVRESDSANDLLQETFLRLHRSRAAYNPAYAVKPWLFGLARNVFLMKRRATRRWTAVHSPGTDLPETPVPAEVDRLGSADEVRRSIAALAGDQAEALLLHHEWGFSFDEIAGMLGVSAVAARARASRGMAELRQVLNPSSLNPSKRVGA
jgi:RNA polymerase sigma-70 factor (ECF subfamily)